MNIQELISIVTDKIDHVSNIESNADSKLSIIEDIRDRANDVGSSLQHYVDNLNALDETLNEADAIVDDADKEDLDY